MNIETLAAKYSAIPPHWKLSTLGESLAGIIGGGTPSRDNPSFWGGDVPWLTVKDMRGRRPTDAQEHITQQAVKESATNIIPPDTVIIASRVGLGKVVRVPFSSAINQDLKALVVGPDLDKSYLEYWLLSIATLLQSIGSGTTVKGIRLETLRQLPIPLAPLQEQREIVAELEKQFSRLDEAVANLQRVKANLKRYKASVLKAAVEGRLVETEATLARREGRTYETGVRLLQRILEERRAKWAGRGKYKEPDAANQTALGGLPDGWTWIAVDAIAFVTKLAGFEYTKYVTYANGGDLAVLKAENAGPDGFRRTDFSRVHSDSVSTLTRSRVGAGDLLMVFVGAGTGNVARTPNDREYFLGPNIAVIRVDPANVNSPYVEMFLRSPTGKNLALGFTKAVAQPSLSMGNIRMIPVALPPIAEQVRIVAEVDRHLSIIREVEAEVDANRQRAQALRHAMLAKAFSPNKTKGATP